jgi:hypothetical protein
MEQQKGVTRRRRFGRPIWTSEIASNTTNPTFLLPPGYFSARRPDRPWQLLKPKGATSSDDHHGRGMRDAGSCAGCGIGHGVTPVSPHAETRPRKKSGSKLLEKSDRASPFNNVDV